ncbi:LysR family transcriptional regulator [Moraxella nasibovis]|uniref:LysR family transcriptional regulator n=1 Tax=Moraxella nasibovis TaxID=2904120 RepID=UPI00240F0397|nr:LysR family transcriptional regulator [Moraxella nasibovis]WFF38499.1 LysR family transcriptional regulator [Moraxella nasibovis]
MDIRHLKYFVAVVEEQSFTKASERLFIAQPPLSRQIQNLEDELGLQLLQRGSRPVKTTDAGQFFYQHAKKVLSNIEQMVSMTKRVGKTDQTLKIGFVGSLLLGLLPQIIYEFRKLLPNVSIDLVEMGTLEQMEALKKGEIDVSFGRLKFSDPSIRRILLRNEPLVLAINKYHPLAQHNDGVHLADIVDEVILCYPNTGNQNFANYINNLFAEHGLTPSNIKYLSNIQLALGIVASGEGVCIVPYNSRSIHMANLQYLPILDIGAVSPIFLSFQEGNDNEYIHLLLRTIELIYQKIEIDTKITLTQTFN